MLTLMKFLLFTLPHFTRGNAFTDALHRWTSFLVSPHTDRLPFDRVDRPITSDTCKGLIPWSCVCQPEVSDSIHVPGTLPVKSISCINARLTDTDVLLSLRSFPNVESATFYGNNFLEFHDRILGPSKHKSLLYLNLTSNNLLYLHQDSFVGTPSLQSLDLSDNAIYLREEKGDWLFVRPLRFLRRLLLRSAFCKPLVNASAQLTLLNRGIRHARLRDLQFLDLSDNNFDHFPSSLVCHTPSLTHLILASNRLRTLHFDKNCPIELKAVDLRWNRLMYFDHGFINAARYFGPISVQVVENPFDCSSSTCLSLNSIRWFQSTDVVKDKETIRCQARRGAGDEYIADSYLLYVSWKQDLQCQAPTEPTTSTTPRATVPTTPATEEASTRVTDLPFTLLSLVGDNETFANNSANAFVAPLAIAIHPINILPLIHWFVIPTVLYICHYHLAQQRY